MKPTTLSIGILACSIAAASAGPLDEAVRFADSMCGPVIVLSRLSLPSEMDEAEKVRACRTKAAEQYLSAWRKEMSNSGD